MVLYSAALLVPFVILTSLGVNQLGVFVSSYLVVHLALRLVFDPKLRLKVDVLGLGLFAAFAYFVAQQVLLSL